jgi:VCBS repeat-containing protein
VTYTVSNGVETDTATLTVTVQGGATPNRPPIAVSDTARVDEDAPLTLDVLSNDSDPEGDPLTITVVNGQAISVGGTVMLGTGALVTLNADGTLDFDQNGAYSALGNGDTALERFTYVVSDGRGGNTVANVDITIDGKDDLPNAVDDAVTLGFDEPGGGVGGKTLQLYAIGTGFSSTASGGAGNYSNLTILGAPETYTFLDDDDFLGGDNAGGERFTEADQLIVINGTQYRVQTDFSNVYSDGTNNYRFAVVDVDLDNDGIGDLGEDTRFVVQIEGPTPPVNVQLTRTTFRNENAIAYEAGGTPDVDGNVLTNDTDPTGNGLTVSQVNASSGGVGSFVAGSNGGLFQNNADGSYDFDANGDFDSLGTGQTSTTSVLYTIDNGAGTDTAALTVTVAGAGGTSPVAMDDFARISESTNRALNLLLNDSDPENDPLSIIRFNGQDVVPFDRVALSSGAELLVGPSNSVTYLTNGAFDSLNDGETEVDTFTYTITDGQGGTDTATVEITIDGVSPPASAVLAFYDYDPQPLIGFGVGATFTYAGPAAAEGRVTALFDNEAGIQGETLDDDSAGAETARADVTVGGVSSVNSRVDAEWVMTLRDTISGDEFEIAEFDVEQGTAFGDYLISEQPMIVGRDYLVVARDTNPNVLTNDPVFTYADHDINDFI